MAQAIPITHQQKIVRSTANVPINSNRWSASSSTQHHSSSTQDSHQPSSSEMLENASAVYESNLCMHSTIPKSAVASSSSTFDGTHSIHSSTIPRQQKPNQSIYSANGNDQIKYNPSSHYSSHQPPVTSSESSSHRRSSYETTLVNVQQQKPFVGNHYEHDATSSYTETEKTPPLEDKNMKSLSAEGTSRTMVVLNADNVISTTEDDGSTTVTITGLSGTGKSSPTMSDSKWTSFDDSEGDGDEASSRHHSESEHQNLLADVDATSDGGDDTTTLTGSVVIVEEDGDSSLLITPPLRAYYEKCYDQLRKEILSDAHSNDGMSKSGDSVGHCSSPPVAASSPAAISAMTNAAAVWGKHARVKEFFERSNLDKSELGQIWALADVNMDGWLNVDEFCVAMHLVVRRVQAGLPVPPLLPAHLRPPMTPPIQSPAAVSASATVNQYGAAGFWTQFPSTSQEVQASAKPITSHHATSDVQAIVGSSTATAAGNMDAQNPVPQSPVVLKDFTNVPPGVAYTNVAQPKPRRVTPESQDRQPLPQTTSLSRPSSAHHSSSAPPNGSKFSAAPAPTPRPRTSTNDSNLSNQKAGSKSPSHVVSPQTGLPPATVPKGPPPKPPPRPTTSAAVVHRHSRSVSLDLTKKMTDMQQQFTMASINFQPNVSGNHVQEFLTPPSAVEVHSTTQKAVPTHETAVIKRETRDVQVQTIELETNSKTKRDSTAPMLDLSMDEKTSIIDATLLKRQQSLGQGADDNSVDDSKDWSKRCERLQRLNADLEKDLKKLSEVRIGLEIHLKRLEKS